MSRYPFASFTFLIMLITFLAIRQSIGVFNQSLNGPFLPAGSMGMELGRAAELVDDVWRRALLFEEWQLDYTASQWDLFRASTPAETDLIAARFHVANAEVFTEAMHQNERAIKELIRADVLLQDAQTSVEGLMTARLHSVRAEIEAAEAKERNNDSTSDGGFETIKQDLDRLIDSLHTSKS